MIFSCHSHFLNSILSIFNSLLSKWSNISKFVDVLMLKEKWFTHPEQGLYKVSQTFSDHFVTVIIVNTVIENIKYKAQNI